MTWSQRKGILDKTTLHAQFREGRLRPTDVVEAVYARLRESHAEGIWISKVPEAQALAEAAALEQRIAACEGPDRLPLYGLPFAVKDNIDVAGMATTAGCPDYAYVPPRSALSVEACRAAGAVLIGKTNLDQFATGLVGTRSPYGACSAAFNDRYISGGSSSGSAVAVARGFVSFALGTDTGGSGRIPAGYNNVVGLKPTRGLVPTTGLVPACRSLDCVSVFALRADDARDVFHAMRCHDPENPFSRPDAETAFLGGTWRPGEPFRFGVLAPSARQFHGSGEAGQRYLEAIDRFVSMGGEVVTVDFAPLQEAGDLLFDGPWIAERYAALADFVIEHPDSVMTVTRRIILDGARFSAADAFLAEHRRRQLMRETHRMLRDLEFVVVPTAPRPYTVAEIAADPIEANSAIGRYSYFVNLLDLCAHAVPNGFVGDNMPSGITLIASPLRDDRLASFSAAYQERLILSDGALAETPA